MVVELVVKGVGEEEVTAREEFAMVSASREADVLWAGAKPGCAIWKGDERDRERKERILRRDEEYEWKERKECGQVDEE